jgi:hypothetical protein
MNRAFSVSRIALIACLLLSRAGADLAARGDVLELKNGGRIEGQIIEGGNGQSAYVIETAAGRVTVASSQVERVETTSGAEREYKDVARNAADTVEAHWKLYEWARDHRLKEISQRHLTRILELDPDHADARAQLGFRQLNGQWLTREDEVSTRGLVMYEGRPVTRQHVELAEREKATRDAQVDWKKNLDRLRRLLTGRNEALAEEAHKEILKIEDPQAAPAVVALLRREDDLPLLRLWIDVAAKLDHQSAVDALVEYSLFHENEDVRYQCLEYLLKSGRSGLAIPYLNALGNSDRAIINRAAAALGRIGDPEAIGPLIEVLVTEHKVQVSPGSGGSMSFSLNNRGGSGMNFGGDGGPKYENRPFSNPDVLTALTGLAGPTGFEYDQAKWRAWLAARAKAQRIDLRRDL